MSKNDYDRASGHHSVSSGFDKRGFDRQLVDRQPVDERRGNRWRLVGAVLALAMLSGCSAGQADGQMSREAEEALAIAGVDAQSSALTLTPEYFTMQRDVRRCASPLCGGYWVRAVNRPATRCADGTLADRCYVAEVDWQVGAGEQASFDHELVVQGQLSSNVFPDFGDLGRFTAVGAWAASTPSPGAGVFVRVVDTGLRCITQPCFSYEAQILNLGLAVSISDVDLAGVGASEAQLEDAAAALAEGELLVAGGLRLRALRSGGRTSTGLALRASQFYLPQGERCYSDQNCNAGERCDLDPCLPPPGCATGRVCPAVCTGYCVAAPDSTCSTDADCEAGNWCRQNEKGGYSCVPFAAEGERCNGFTLPWMYEQCAPELVCDTPEFVADAPGTCRAPCKSNTDCVESQYCAIDGLCHEDGSCDLSVDCTLTGNTYIAPACVGYPTCPLFGEGDQCTWSCGDSRCLDLRGVDFGPCDAMLGFGVLNGSCTAISGCSAGGMDLFASEEECSGACSASP